LAQITLKNIGFKERQIINLPGALTRLGPTQVQTYPISEKLCHFSHERRRRHLENHVTSVKIKSNTQFQILQHGEVSSVKNTTTNVAK